MAEPPNELKANIDEPDAVNVVEPGDDEPKVDTSKYFHAAKKYTVRDELIKWGRKEAAKAGFTIVIEKSDN
ncbi:otubain, partial [Trifolium medium]|nr:otubain [Trifolium medium]